MVRGIQHKRIYFKSEQRTKLMSLIKNMFCKVFRHNSFRNIGTLFSGTIIAQLITITFSPMLTRLYSPADFGDFSLYIATASILSIISCGRYELAITLPDSVYEALALVGICIGLATIFSAILLVASVFISYNWFKFVAISVLLYGLYQPLYYWFNRHQGYKILSRSRVYQATVTTFISILVGYNEYGATGLIVSSIMGQVAGAFFLIWTFVRSNYAFPCRIKAAFFYTTCLRYSNFPKYLTISHAINTFSTQIPTYAIAFFFGSVPLGFFSLAQKVIGLPLGIISDSIGDVFRQEASKEFRSNNNCLSIFRRTFVILLIIGVVPAIILAVGSPWLFNKIFGAEWTLAGTYVRYLTPFFLMTLLFRPLSMMFIIAEKQKWDIIYQICRISCIGIILAITLYFNMSAETFIQTYSLGISALNLMALWNLYSLANGRMF